MVTSNLFRSALLTAGASLALASVAFAADPPAPPATPAEAAAPAPAATAVPAAKPEAKAETDAASNLEKKFQEAARSYRKVERNGETMYCKKEKPINSTIPRLQCITESQLRLQVEQMDDLRDRMRNSSRCTLGPGCSAG